jgi:glycosyltransferase involved in cell wall biosynthesis
MRRLYDAADVLLMPTLMDNLPNTVVEAMACSTPCVAFNVGGLPQMITPGVDGYLARYKDAADLAEGIKQVLSSPNYPEMAKAAREKAVSTYSEAAVAQRFIALYKNLLSPQSEVGE